MRCLIIDRKNKMSNIFHFFYCVFYLLKGFIETTWCYIWTTFPKIISKRNMIMYWNKRNPMSIVKNISCPRIDYISNS